MKVTEAEARALLAAVRKASETTQRAHSEMMDASAERAEAVRAAMEAGVPREQIADAAGVDRSILYRLVRRDTPS